MIHESVYELRKSVAGSVRVSKGTVQVVDAEKLRKQDIDVLVRDAVFGAKPVKDYARWLIWEAGQALDARPASVHDFYISRADNRWQDRTVPAMNIRFTTYDTARAAFRAAQKTNAGAFVFEIARSEMGYTDQEPMEYSAALIAAAIKEGYKRPDLHPGRSLPGEGFGDLQEEIRKRDQRGEGSDRPGDPGGGFWNIDIDTSTLVTPEPETLKSSSTTTTRSAKLTNGCATWSLREA